MTTKVDECRILSLVKETSSKYLARSRTLSRRQECHCQSQQSRDTFINVNAESLPQSKPLVPSKNRKPSVDLARKHQKKKQPAEFWKPRLTFARMTGREESGERKKQPLIQSHLIIFQMSGGSVVAGACLAASGTGSMMFIDDVTADDNV